MFEFIEVEDKKYIQCEILNFYPEEIKLLNNEKSNIQGSGVGLYLTRKILEEQGGSIMVKSKVNEGSLFTIILSKN